MIRIIFIFLLFMAPAYASADITLDQIIDKICFNLDAELSIDEESCMLYYVNCAVGPGGEWSTENLLNCIVESHVEREER